MKAKDTIFQQKQLLNCRGKLIDLTTPKVMGIMNITPDSFYDGGRYLTEEAIRQRLDKMVSEGADFIDLGAFSTRPGAGDVPPEEEIKRLDKALPIIFKRYPDLLVSLDTFRSGVADMVLSRYPVCMINDISAGMTDPLMIPTVATYQVPYVLMHMQGAPQTMQDSPRYTHVTEEVIGWFALRVEVAKKAGVHDIIIDPGFGFGKTLQHNYQLLESLDALRIFELPILAGLSRKSMIYKTLNVSADEALIGTSVLNMVALQKGASILRVHDVKEAVEVIRLFSALQGTP